MYTQQGISFDGGSPVMEGTWYNPTTGESFTVRDTFFEDNQIVVQTTDGKVLKYEELQRYVKSDKPITPEPKAKPKPVEQLPAEVASLIDGGDNMMLDEDVKALGSLNIQNQYEMVQEKIPEQSMNAKIVEKALSKTEAPEITVSINWKKFPKNEIEMLQNLMDISTQEVIDYYVNRISMKDVTKIVINKLENHIQKTLDKTEEVEKTKDKKPVKKQTNK